MGKGKKFEKFIKAEIAKIDFFALYKNKKGRDASPVRAAPVEAPKKAKVAKPKKERDPNAPRKGAGPYFKFANAQPTKDRVRKVLGEKPKNADVNALKKQMWEEMTPEDKKPYLDEAKVESDRFARQMAEYKATGKFSKEDPPAAAVVPAPVALAPAKKTKKTMFSSSSSSSDSSSI